MNAETMCEDISYIECLRYVSDKRKYIVISRLGSYDVIYIHGHCVSPRDPPLRHSHSDFR